ncbi:hypothetical protein B4N89_02495 [Embleya scabrispora]|uniref:Uncharacterized protein n=1 Tax=Embleya scabrispora TaxID=159449 RepID=A0A1T3NT46_9ACTN|nr:hypothetical protein [Embleya scabrispora]OPC79966.1 hypothetical protein B4N89_02495 [Embleya scabrispora]
MTAPLKAAAPTTGAAAPILWTADNPPPADGCRWCGRVAATHGPTCPAAPRYPRGYERPTRAQRVARIAARWEIAQRRLVRCDRPGCRDGWIAPRPGDPYRSLRPTACTCVDGWIDPDLDDEEVCD